MPLDVQLAPNAFCTPDDVRSALGNSDISADNDNTFRRYINMFSKMAEGTDFCDRKFLKQEYTEYFDGILSTGYGVQRLFLNAYPIDSAEDFTIYDDLDRLWTDGTGNTKDTRLVLWRDYRVDYENGIVAVTFDSAFNYDFHTIKVVWTGGVFEDNSDGTASVPDDLRMACAIQVAHSYKMANDPGAVQISALGGGQVTMYTPTELLPIVKKILHGYKRHVY